MTGEVLDVIRELAEAGQSIVLATHEISFARQVADWVVFLAAGKVQESSSASQFFTQPQTELAQQYLVGLSKYR
jgi:ABC-type histidine transport system ATPase subunit